MSDVISKLIGPDDEPWDASKDDAKRQAIASLRGYAYQLHQSLAAWIALPDDATLHLEIAEDYSTIIRDPASLEAVLEATQIKDTRESGSVTLNSPDVLDAIRHFWALRTANPGKGVRFVFLTSSPVGKERKNPLSSGATGLEAWIKGARGAPLEDLRAALERRLADNDDLLAFIQSSTDDELRRDLIEPIRWVCGAPAIEGIAADNRAALVVLGQELGGAPDLSSRAADNLLIYLLTIILTSEDRRLRRGDLLAELYRAITVRVPVQQLFAGPERIARGIDLAATGAWRTSAPPSGPHALRASAVSTVRAALGADGVLWLHGATGMGKSMLAELAAHAYGGSWQVLDLRGAGGPAARERLVAARLAILGDPKIVGLIIDDLSPQLERDIEGPVTELAASLSRRGTPVIITSNHPPDQRLARAVGLRDDGVHLAPSFETEDAAELVAAYGGDPAKWSWFALLAGSAHPQLVDSVIAGLARRGWPESAMRDWVAAGMKNDDVEGEREAARRRLLGELAPNVLGLLARTVRIYGTFDRRLALASAAVDPALDAPGLGLDQLTGHWIERLEAGRLRASPLVNGLDQETLSPDELRSLDLAIVVHILTRKSVDADLIDTAFYHAWVAENESWINVIVQHVIGTSDDDRPKLASAVPMFRQAEAVPQFLKDRPFMVLLLRLAQHLLVSSIAKADELSRSADTLVSQLDELPETEIEAQHATSVMILMKVLFDSYGFGRIPNWFAWLRRFSSLVRGHPEFNDFAKQLEGTTSADAIGFLFVAHAAHLPGIAPLIRLFGELDALPLDERQLWLAALHEPSPAMMMIIDNAWLKDVQAGDIDGLSKAESFEKLGHAALRWNEPKLASHCFRAQAVMLDEYAKDPEAAYRALDAAEQHLPANFNLDRERAKIAWRANDYQSALEQLLALESRLSETEPLDAAFAMREAGVSAGKLERWADAERLFRKAREFALKSAADQPSPFAVGLAADAATMRFLDGDRAGAIRGIAEVLGDLAKIDPEQNLTARSVHLITRHLILWMFGHIEQVEVDGEEPAFVAGAASNPDPKREMSTLPVSALAPAWMLVSRVALDAGITPDEIFGWPGMSVARASGDMDAMIRAYMLDHALRTGSIMDFGRFLVPAIEAYDHMARARARGDEPDPLNPKAGSIAELSREALAEHRPKTHIRDAALTFHLLAPQGRETSQPLHSTLRDLVLSATGYDPLPEWSSGQSSEESDIHSAIAIYLSEPEAGATLSPDRLFVAHLRMFEWMRSSNHGELIRAEVAKRVQSDWSQVIENRRALLVSPALTIPAIASALSSNKEGLAYVANLLLAAEATVSNNLSPEFRSTLHGLAQTAN
jgi:hypothetical protein